MHLSKLTKVLQTFDHNRLLRLKKYVHSPFFGVYPPSVTLFDYLTPLHPRFSDKKVSVEAIGAQHENLSSLSKQESASTRLMRAVEQFIALEEWQKNEAEVARYMLKGFKELSLTAEFEKGFEKEMQHINLCAEQNFDTFFARHALTELSFNGFDARLHRTAENNIMPVVKTLDEFYALKKLRYLCEALNRQNVFGAKYEDEHLPAVFKILEPYTNPKYPYVYLFVNAYRMMEETTYAESDMYYRLLKQVIERQTGVLAHGIREAADYALNCSLRWYNKGYEEAGNEYLWWIEWKQKNNLLLQQEKLMPVTFRNIINIAVSNKKSPEWINKWIKAYAPHLPGEHYDTNLSFAKGLYHYAIKQYKEAVRFFLLAQAKDEVLFNGNLRLWEWMCLYEFDPNDTDTLFNHLLSFEKYLQRNKEGLRNKFEVFNQFIHYAFILLKSSKGDTISTGFSDLQSEEYFPRKAWLLQQFAAKNKKPAPHKAGRVKVH